MKAQKKNPTIPSNALRKCKKAVRREPPQNKNNFSQI
jgi:hypothetical protein